MNTKKKITEKQNPESNNIHKKDIKDILAIINKQDAKISKSISIIIPLIEKFILSLVESLLKGGRLIYVGSGSSGRLGVLDAAECPPTFNTKKNLIVGVIAGGNRALSESIENAEDDRNDGSRQMLKLNISKNDVILGISASGSTPFVLGAIEEAYNNGCITGLITFNKIKKTKIVKHLIELNVGPEIIAGSTRMKAGTATKMILNMITTTSMIKLNKTYGNLMVDLTIKNNKLKKRAIRIIKQLTDLDDLASNKLLIEAKYEVKTAITMYYKNCDYKLAKMYLKQNNGSLELIINEK